MGGAHQMYQAANKLNSENYENINKELFDVKSSLFGAVDGT